MNFTGKALSDIFWQLEYVNTPLSHNPVLGGQNFTTCCLKAINDAIEVGPSGHLQFVNQFQDWIVFDEGESQPLDLLFNYSLRGQFPCTAVYNGDARGAPIVKVNYTWLAETCPGWQISSTDNLNAWLQPLSGFLIPAIIFCLSVPRRRKLEVPRFLFSPDQGGIKSYLLAPFGAILALVMVSIDTLVWLCICFAFAGPMILSGLYEAMLDNSVLEYLRLKIDESRLTLDMRCRCLMVILIGNLDLVWNTEDPDGNGGYVDGGTHGGSYIGGRVGDGDDEGDPLNYNGDGGGAFDNRHARGNSAEIPLVAMHGSGAYQSVPGGDMSSPSQHPPYAPYSSSYPYAPYSHDQSGAGPAYGSGPQAPAGYGVGASPSPSGASLSPGSPTPVLPATLGGSSNAYIPHQPQQLNSIENAAFRGSPPTAVNAPWSQPNHGSGHGFVDPNGAGQQGVPFGATHMVVPPPPPPIPAADEHGTAPADGGHRDSVIPGLYISPASAGPDPEPMQSPFQPQQQQQYQHSHMGPVPGFPPGHAGPSQPAGYGHYSGAASPGAPSTPIQQHAGPAAGNIGTPFAGSGFVAAGVVAAGIGVGVSHDANRRLFVNHQNGGPLASPWQHMEEFLYDLRLYEDDYPTRQHSPRQYAKHQICPDGINCHDEAHNEPPIQRTQETERFIHQAKTRLKTMLHCQYSFGSVIGAPVVFFLGGFIFALLQSLDTLGDEDIAEGLAFGQWYMTIPHIAIISGLLLAGNNPNILEGVLAVERKYRQDNITFMGITYGLAYPSCYKVAWLWDRGYNKKKWLDTLIATYLVRYNAVYSGNEDYDKDIVDLKKKTTLSISDWAFLLSLTLMLLGLPYILAFLTAYFTPEVGLSCRSLTFTIYIIVQTFQIILWLWAYAGPLAIFNVENPGFFQIGGWLDKRGFYEPYSVRWMVDRGQAVPRNPFKLMRLVWNNPRRLANWRCLWNIVYYSSQWLLGIIGITAAIGGTAMQLVGVYSADICYITTQYWFAPLEERPQPIISVNSADMIRESELMWKPCAITAIVFMSVVSFVGWWYQRRMRDLFQDQVRRIDQNERRDTRNSRPDRGRVRPRAVSGAPLTIRTLTPSIPSAVPVAPRSISGASAVTTGYGGYGSYSGQGGVQGRPYGSLSGRNSMAMMSSALSAQGAGSNTGISSSLSAQGGNIAPGSVRAASGIGSIGGRTPSPMGAGIVGTLPDDGTGRTGFAPPAGSLIPGSTSIPGPSSGLVTGAAAGPSRRTPYRRTPSPNEPLEEAEEPPLHAVRRAVLRSAASASTSVARTATSTSTSTAPLVRSIAAQAARRPAVNSLAIATRYFSQTARVAEAEEASSPAATGPAATTPSNETSKEGETPYSLHVRNIVFDASDAHLKEAFEHYGAVTKSVIARDARGMSRGYGFVWFETEEAKNKAREEANGSFWHGRRIEVNERLARREQREATQGKGGPTWRSNSEPTTSIYIGNLPYETTDVDLNEIFSTLKGLKAVRVAVDRATGWPRGFAHADFDTVENSAAAFEYLKDKSIGSRTLRIDYALNRRSPPAFGEKIVKQSE
ncbi:hypothetical protein SEUCBS139899_005440 [Sporothrix eucalyptigena]|uniref:RRM domain-containing protein n=1 Tax=Sporothrix eucalyptigena TaxID=1812306 RepID=A0ABP0CSU5_9PEZI